MPTSVSAGASSCSESRLSALVSVAIAASPVAPVPLSERSRSAARLAATATFGVDDRVVTDILAAPDHAAWIDAQIAGVPSADTWLQWVYEWDTTDVRRGDHVVEARALDGEGIAQIEEPKAVAPDGAQGFHRVTIDVTT